jgi:hypothetical protein
MKTVLQASLLLVSVAVAAGCHRSDSAPQAAVETIRAPVVESRQHLTPVNLR